uniref:Myb-like domain-containing protein n=1 Tax=Brassica oleracea var. oleracea TaxID=109376 RepID=A0A0D3APK6_BRAOL
MGRYSYSQPSSSSHSPDLTSLLEAEGEVYAAEAEITRWNAEAIDWEPSPEGDDGIPRTCYCGSEPVHGYSQTPKDPYRCYITCPNADDRDCHVWKWWDMAVEEELREFQRELNGVKGEANQREQKLLRLEKQVSKFTKKKSGAKLMEYLERIQRIGAQGPDEYPVMSVPDVPAKSHVSSPTDVRAKSAVNPNASGSERRKWTPTEDKILIGAWLNTSKDPVMSNEQKSTSFWKRIVEYYNASRLLAGTVPRETTPCKQRWSRINGEVSKFCGSYDAALREQRSGQNDDDVLEYHMEFLETLGCIWSSKERQGEVAPAPRATSSERQGEVAPAPRATSSERQGEVAPAPRATSSERQGEVAPAPRATSSERQGEVAPAPRATSSERQGEVAPAPRATSSERQGEVAPAPRATSTLNDINVLDRSPVFDDILEGRAPRVRYMVNGHMYKLAYYLTDGIYPKWSTFIQSITLPQCPKQALFAKWQEAARKDVERAFGVLQARFAIVKNPVRTLDIEKIGKIMRACIILHNMIVEDERDGYTNRVNISDFQEGESSRTSEVLNEIPTLFNDTFPDRNDLRDRQTHDRLKNDLIENIWNKFGNQD